MIEANHRLGDHAPNLGLEHTWFKTEPGGTIPNLLAFENCTTLFFLNQAIFCIKKSPLHEGIGGRFKVQRGEFQDKSLDWNPLVELRF